MSNYGDLYTLYKYQYCSHVKTLRHLHTCHIQMAKSRDNLQDIEILDLNYQIAFHSQFKKSFISICPQKSENRDILYGITLTK